MEKLTSIVTENGILKLESLPSGGSGKRSMFGRMCTFNSSRKRSTGEKLISIVTFSQEIKLFLEKIGAIWCCIKYDRQNRLMYFVFSKERVQDSVKVVGKTEKCKRSIWGKRMSDCWNIKTEEVNLKHFKMKEINSDRSSSPYIVFVIDIDNPIEL